MHNLFIEWIYRAWIDIGEDRTPAIIAEAVLNNGRSKEDEQRPSTTLGTGGGTDAISLHLVLVSPPTKKNDIFENSEIDLIPDRPDEPYSWVVRASSCF